LSAGVAAPPLRGDRSRRKVGRLKGFAVRRSTTILLSGFVLLGLAGCSYYRPTPAERIHIVDAPTDVNACHRLGVVSVPVTTSPGFASLLEGMILATVELGGTDLYLQRSSHDWSVVRGIAYHCAGTIDRAAVVRVRG
jgi:hypothetical protein